MMIENVDHERDHKQKQAREREKENQQKEKEHEQDTKRSEKNKEKEKFNDKETPLEDIMDSKKVEKKRVPHMWKMEKVESYQNS
ncbi:hypothetical protein RDI58_028955 [Solanum bulbocastanum]|uniref:Uncharacterized protein n=1 Tax=Solanum bulbocastanum TaxID=147425 RepID=A0AAN8SVX5_SOLBU